MAKAKRTRRGPVCPVCNAVMSPPDSGGDPVCWQAKNHAAIVEARVKAMNRAAEAQRKKKEK